MAGLAQPAMVEKEIIPNVRTRKVMDNCLERIMTEIKDVKSLYEN